MASRRFVLRAILTLCGWSGLVVAAVAAVGAWSVVFTWRIGRTVAVVDAGAGRGVHSGDFLAVPLVAGAVIAAGLGVTALDRARRRRDLPHRASATRPTPVLHVPSIAERLAA